VWLALVRLRFAWLGFSIPVTYGTVNCWVANVPAVVVILMLIESPESSVAPRETVMTVAPPLASGEDEVICGLAPLVPTLHEEPEAPPGVLHTDDCVKPALLGDPWTSSVPSCSETEPTLRTMMTTCPEPTPVVKVAESIEMLDWAAMFCWLCCPPAADDVWLRNP